MITVLLSVLLLRDCADIQWWSFLEKSMMHLIGSYIYPGLDSKVSADELSVFGEAIAHARLFQIECQGGLLPHWQWFLGDLYVLLQAMGHPTPRSSWSLSGMLAVFQQQINS